MIRLHAACPCFWHSGQIIIKLLMAFLKYTFKQEMVQRHIFCPAVLLFALLILQLVVGTLSPRVYHDCLVSSYSLRHFADPDAFSYFSILIIHWQ